MALVDDAHHNVTSWLQAVTNSARFTALHLTQVAKLLADLPVIAKAVAASEIGIDQLRPLVGLHSNPRSGHPLADSEELLLSHARGLRLREFRPVCQLNEFIDRHAAIELEHDIDWRSNQYGDCANEYPLPRTNKQRRYDAFIAIMNNNAGTGSGSGSDTPLVNIFTNETTLRYAIRNQFGHVTDDLGDRGMSERLWMCHTASGAPVDPHDLVIAALLGNIRKVVSDTTGRVIDLGRKSRLFTGAVREAVLLSANRCRSKAHRQRHRHTYRNRLAPPTKRHRNRTTTVRKRDVTRRR